MGTCALESDGGSFLVEENGPALGIFQMEPKTHDDLWRTFLPVNPKLTHDMIQICRMAIKPTADMMVYHLFYATAMARVFYARIKEPIPTNLESQAAYYKEHWNTKAGKSTIQEYIDCYNRFIGKLPRKTVK